MGAERREETPREEGRDSYHKEGKQDIDALLSIFHKGPFVKATISYSGLKLHLLSG